MIDIHCHILPNVDDGASHLEDSIAMAKTAVQEGIHTIVATPHHKNGRYNNPKNSVLADLEKLKQRIEQEEIPLTILPGQEIHIHGEMIEGYEEGELLTLNETSRYIFVELPTNHIPRFTKQLLFDIQMQDLVPIIVHPERNNVIREHPSQLYEFVRNGALTQITAGSLVGKFATKIKRFTNQIIEHNLTHFIASDAHNIKTRGFFMSEANQTIKQTYGEQTLYTLMENAQLAINNDMIYIDEPHRIKPKKFFGLF